MGVTSVVYARATRDFKNRTMAVHKLYVAANALFLPVLNAYIA